MFTVLLLIFQIKCQVLGLGVFGGEEKLGDDECIALKITNGVCALGGIWGLGVCLILIEVVRSHLPFHNRHLMLIQDVPHLMFCHASFIIRQLLQIKG